MKMEPSQKTHHLDFIGIGAQKSGTSWIAACLAEHPEICMPKRQEDGKPIKEIHFFDRMYEKGIAHYHSFFGHCSEKTVTGEYTPMYLFDERVPNRIYRYNPDIKLIVCLRNPIDRAYSQYLAGKKMWGGGTLLEAMDQTPEILERGFYARQLKRYLELFPREQMHISIYEDIEKDPVVFMQRVYSFLGVDTHHVPQGIKQKRNVSKGVQSKYPALEKGRQKIRGYTAQHPQLKRILKMLNVRRIETKLQRFNTEMYDMREKPTLSSQIRAQLRHIYESDIQEVEKLLGRELHFWK